MAAAASKTPAWVTFTGTLLLLIGIFFGARTLVNMFLFTKYPTTPSTSLAGLIGFGSNINEESCNYSAVGTSGTPDPTCLKMVADARDTARVTDITNAVFFVFIGGGVLYTRKRFNF